MAPWWIVAAGCAGDGSDDRATPTFPHETGAPTGPTGPTGETGLPTPTHPRPTSVTASCEPTENALRLACHVTVDPPQPVQIAFEKADGSGRRRVHQGLDEAAEHDVDLYFVAPSTAYDWTASAVDWPGDPVATGEFTTGAAPIDHASHLAVDGASTTPYVGTNLPCVAGANAAVFDTATGELLWYEVMDPSGIFGGYQMVQFTEDHTVLGLTGPEVVEVDLAGRELLRRVSGADYDLQLHHDLFKHDGRYWLLFHEGSPLLDGFVVWDATGAEVARWWSGDHLLIPGWATGDYLHTNTIFVKDDAVWMSSFEQNTLYKVNGDLDSPDFGQVQWVLAGSPYAELGQDFALDWTLIGEPTEFQHQHHLNVLPDGRVMFLDNQHGRGLVMTLDEVARTARIESSYEAGYPTCGPQGTATMTAAGGALVDCSGMWIREYGGVSLEPSWTAQLVCENGNLGGGTSNSPERWYPLDGW